MASVTSTSGEDAEEEVEVEVDGERAGVARSRPASWGR